MRKFWYLAAMIGATLLATMTAGPAYATHAVLTSGSLDGPATSGTISAPSKSTINFYQSGTTTGVSCFSNLSDTITSNPPAPGTALGSFTFSWTRCTENLSGTTCVKSVVSSTGSYSGSISSDFTVVINGPIGFTIVMCSLLGDITCSYVVDSLRGTWSNDDHSITFPGRLMTKVSGPSGCPSFDFSGTYGPVTDGAGVYVYVN